MSEIVDIDGDMPWELWEAAGLRIGMYSSSIDADSVRVFKCICDNMFNDDIARKLALSPDYVEVIQTMFCALDWCTYGTSPRVCFPDKPDENAANIAKLEAWFFGKWGCLIEDHE